MKKVFFITGIFMGVMLLTLPVLAQSEETIEMTQPVEVGNKICPVSGEKVGEMGDVVTYEYNGKIYNLCCAMCAKDFKKNPEKYSNIAENEVNNEEILEDLE
ncbi:MAG: TRASH domain-containing protein [Candidatus Omnitrophota bacterium]